MIFYSTFQHEFHDTSEKSDSQDYMRPIPADLEVPAKRNFDEIDRFGLNRFVQTPSHSLWAKRNFDQIDRIVPQMYANGIAKDNERNDQYSKF